MACGAGNSAIVELLLRHGCAIQVTDCFGSIPADHAMRNGFQPLAALLQERVQTDNGMKSSGINEGRQHVKRNDDKTRKKQQKQLEKLRLQEAFANLSLKDKLMLNMLVKHRMKRPLKSKGANKIGTDVIIEECEGEIECEKPGCDHGLCVGTEVGMNPENEENQYGGRSSVSEGTEGSDDVSIVISESDKESLDIAMRLMNTEVSCFEKSHGLYFARVSL